MRVICLALGPERTRKHLLTFLQGEMVRCRHAALPAPATLPARATPRRGPHPPLASARASRHQRRRLLAAPRLPHLPARPRRRPPTRLAATPPTGPPPRAQELGKYMDEVLVAIAYNLGRCVEFIGPMSELPWCAHPPRPTAIVTQP